MKIQFVQRTQSASVSKPVDGCYTGNKTCLL